MKPTPLALLRPDSLMRPSVSQWRGFCQSWLLMHSLVSPEALLQQLAASSMFKGLCLTLHNSYKVKQKTD